MADEMQQGSTVLGADDLDPKVTFTIRERQGTPVFKFRAEDHPDAIDAAKLTDITREDGLVPGDKILVQGLMGGYHLLTVEAHPEGGLSAKNDSLLAILEFGKDDRGAWVCTGLVNKRVLSKLRITT